MFFNIIFFISIFFTTMYCAQDQLPKFFVGDESSVHVFNSANEHLETISYDKLLHDVSSIALDSDNNILYAINRYGGNNYLGSLLIIDLDDIDFDDAQASIIVIQDNTDSPFLNNPLLLSLSPDHNTLVIAQDQNAITLIDLEGLTQDNIDDHVTVISNPENGKYFHAISDVIFSQDGTKLYVASYYGGSINTNDWFSCGLIAIVDLEEGEVVSVLDNSGAVANGLGVPSETLDVSGSALKYPTALTLSSGNNFLYVTNNNGPGAGENGFLSVIYLDEDGLFTQNDGWVSITIVGNGLVDGDFQNPKDISIGFVGEYDEPYVFIVNQSSLLYIPESSLLEDEVVFSKIGNADLISNPYWPDGLFIESNKLLFGQSSDTGQRLLFILNSYFVTVMGYEDIILGDGGLTTLLENNMFAVPFIYNYKGGLQFDGRYLYISHPGGGLDGEGSILQVDVETIDFDNEIVEQYIKTIKNAYPIDNVKDLYFDEQEERLYVLNRFDNKSSVSVYQCNYDPSAYIDPLFTPIFQQEILGANYNMVVDTQFRKLYIQSTGNNFLGILPLDNYQDYTELNDEIFGFDYPLSMTIDDIHHRLYIVNEDGESVTVVNTADDTLVTILRNANDAEYGDIAVEDDFLDEPEWVVVDTVHNRLYVYEGEDDSDDDFILVFDTTDDAYTFLGVIDNDSLRATSGIEDDTNDYFEDIETMIVDETRNRLYVINQENAVTVIDTTDDAFSLIQWITIDYLQSVSGVDDDNTFYFSESERAFLDVQNQKLYVPNYEEPAVLVLDVSGELATLDAFIQETDEFDFSDPFCVFVRSLNYSDIITADFALTGDFIDKGLYVGTENFVINVPGEDLEITFTQHNFKIHHLARDEDEVVMIPENTQVLITNTQTEEVVSGTIVYGFITFGLHENGSPIPTVGYIECIDENDVEYELVLGEGHDVITFARTEHITDPSSQNFVRRHTDKHRNR